MNSTLFTTWAADQKDSAARIAVMSAQKDCSTFAVGMLAAFSAFCGALFVVDLAQRKAVDRVRLRYAGTDLNGGGIVGLLRRHGGEAT